MPPYVGSAFGGFGGGGGDTYGVIFGNYLGVTGMYDTNSPANTNFQVSEVGFYADLTRENAGLLAVASSSPGAGTLANLTDADFGTRAFYPSTGMMKDNNRAYLGFDFGEARPDINGVRFGNYDNGNLVPYQCDVIQSSDGANWAYVAYNISTPVGSVNNWGTIGSFAMEYPDAGEHVYWRIAAIDQTDVSGGNRPLWVSGIGLYTGVLDVTSQASKATSMSFTSGTIADWFDGNLTTYPQIAYSETVSGTITFTFPGPIRVNGLRFDAASGLNPDFNYMHRCTLQYSDNATDWTDAGRVAALTFPGAETAGGITRLY